MLALRCLRLNCAGSSPATRQTIESINRRSYRLGEFIRTLLREPLKRQEGARCELRLNLAVHNWNQELTR